MISVLTIGYDRNVFDAGSDVRARMRVCAEAAGELHMVVFSRTLHDCREAHDGPLHIYPTNARSRIGMLWDAYRIAKRLLDSGAGTSWIISPQDPFETGVIGYLLHRMTGAALQVQVHGDFFGSPWWQRESPLNRVRSLFGKWLLRRAPCVRTVSQRAVGSLERVGVPPHRITLLPVMADLSAFQEEASHADLSAPRASRQAGLRAQFPHADPLVLTVGRLVPSKQFDMLIRSFLAVVDVHPHAQLVIVGSGPEEEMLKALALRLDLTHSVAFIPWSDTVPAYMRTADIFAFPSSYEGWGRVILEAMAAGLPSVVTDVGCVGEVFLDQVHGRVVPVADEQAFRDELIALAGDRAVREQYAAAAKRDAASYAYDHIQYAEAWVRTLRACHRISERV